MEHFDILDENGNRTGETATYGEVHTKGLIHRSVHVWIINSKGQILIQKRGKNMGAFPGYWDISSSGHVSSGEDSLKSAQRETREELGIDIPIEEFKYLFTLREKIILNNGEFINNEFQDVYLVKKDLNISELKIQGEELDMIKFVDHTDFEKMINDNSEPVVPHKDEYLRILNLCSIA